MGYFSNLCIIDAHQYEDHSYHSVDSQILWRIDDLSERYAELVKLDAPCCGEDSYTEDEYRSVPVEFFETLIDVARAIEIAEAALCHNCNTAFDEENTDFENESDETEIHQLKIFEEYDSSVTAMPQLAA